MNSERLGGQQKRKLEELFEQQVEQNKRLRREGEVCGQAFDDLMRKTVEEQRQLSAANEKALVFIRGSEKEYFQGIQKIRANLQQLRKV